MVKTAGRKRKKHFEIKNLKKYELVIDFLIKLNLLAIPMYLALYAGISYYPAQKFLTDIIYGTFKSNGYWIDRNDLTIMLFAPAEPPGPPLVQTIWMGFDCTAWKTMYAFAALVIASPVPDRRKKFKFILIGGVALFALNIVRLITTISAAYSLGFEALEIIHTVLWREGLIIALLALWFVWLSNQKNNISKSQTILRALYCKIKGNRIAERTAERGKIQERGKRGLKKRKLKRGKRKR